MTPQEHAAGGALDMYINPKRLRLYQRGGWARMLRTGDQARCYRAEQAIACSTPQCQRLIMPGCLFTFYPPVVGPRRPRCRICMPFRASCEEEE